MLLRQPNMSRQRRLEKRVLADVPDRETFSRSEWDNAYNTTRAADMLFPQPSKSRPPDGFPSVAECGCVERQAMPSERETLLGPPNRLVPMVLTRASCAFSSRLSRVMASDRCSGECRTKKGSEWQPEEKIPETGRQVSGSGHWG